MIKIASFDVFDTCLTRSVLDPNDIFILTAAKIARSLATSANSVKEYDIFAARLRADKIARHKSSCEEPSLQQIWTEVADLLGIPSLKQAWAVELEVEHRSLLPINKIRDTVKEALRKHGRVIYISDTYFPEAFILEQLSRFDFPARPGTVYTSSKWGVRKSSGGLFLKVLEQERIAASELIHHGDNNVSDVLVPRSLGIRSNLTPRKTPEHFVYDLLKQCALPRLVVSSIAKQIMLPHLIRDEYSRSLPTECAVRELIGPALVAYVAWVLKAAKSAGVKRLYFMARDGRLAYAVAKTLTPSIGGPECRYLKISRQAVFLPSAVDINPEAMPWLRRDFEEPRLSNLLAKLELPWEEFVKGRPTSAGLETPDTILASEGDWQAFWGTLRTETVSTALRTKIAIRRRAALGYFRSEGLLDDVHWGMVDLGWHAQCQRALGVLLRTERPNLRIEGFYLGLEINQAILGNIGSSSALFYRDSHQHERPQDETLFHHEVLWEHIFGQADHPWVSHYAASGSSFSPQYGGAPLSQEALGRFYELEAELVAYTNAARIWADEASNPQVSRSVIATLLTNTISSPSSDLLQFLTGIVATTDQSSSQTIRVVSPYKTSEALGSILPYRLRSAFGTRRKPRLMEQASLQLSPCLSRTILHFGECIRRISARA